MLSRLVHQRAGAASESQTKKTDKQRKKHLQATKTIINSAMAINNGCQEKVDSRKCRSMSHSNAPSAPSPSVLPLQWATGSEEKYNHSPYFLSASKSLINLQAARQINLESHALLKYLGLGCMQFISGW